MKELLIKGLEVIPPAILAFIFFYILVGWIYSDYKFDKYSVKTTGTTVKIDKEHNKSGDYYVGTIKYLRNDGSYASFKEKLTGSGYSSINEIVSVTYIDDEAKIYSSTLITYKIIAKIIGSVVILIFMMALLIHIINELKIKDM